jgi:hypothetical protein
MTIEEIEKLLEYDGSVSCCKHKEIKNFIYRNANKHFGIELEEEELYIDIWKHRLSKGY